MQWMSLRFFKKNNQQNVFTNHIYIINMYKEDLALNNLQCLICYETNPTNPCDFFTPVVTGDINVVRVTANLLGSARLFS